MARMTVAECRAQGGYLTYVRPPRLFGESEPVAACAIDGAAYSLETGALLQGSAPAPGEAPPGPSPSGFSFPTWALAAFAGLFLLGLRRRR